MKKTLIILFFFNLNLCTAQDTFVRKYTSYVTKFDGKLSEWADIDLTVVYNEKNTDNVVLYYPNKTITLYKIGSVEKDKTKAGDEYQLIECVDNDGLKVSLQLFNDVLRILMVGGFIEFHQ